MPHDLDEEFGWHRGPVSLRFIYLHLIPELAAQAAARGPLEIRTWTVRNRTYVGRMTESTAHNPLLDLIILDCPDALALAQFYSELLGWPLEEGADRDWANLVPPGGGISPENPDGRPALAFQRIDDWVAPTWPGGAHPQRFHLDFSVGDIEAAEPSVLALGARRHDHQPSQDGGFRVYLDPAGHPFCLIR